MQILGLEPSPSSARVDKNERQIQVALISDELAKKCNVETGNEAAKSKTAKLSIKVKSKGDSPDEGYVGESVDTTDV